MAHIHPDYPNTSRGFCREHSWRRSNHLDISLINNSTRTWQNSGHRIGKRTSTWETQRAQHVPSLRCCNSSTSEVTTKLGGTNGDGFGYLVNEYYGWKVRRMVGKEAEIRKVALVQAEGFHVPVTFFNDMFFQYFQAEVLSGLLYRLRNSPPDRYACLVAEPSCDSQQDLIVGVVDVTVLRGQTVLQHLPGADEYLYVSGIAVLNNFRRRKVATALLKACEALCVLWGYEYLVLRAYEDDSGARNLYSDAGYRLVSSDPAWMTTWVGRKRRVLMIKRPNPNKTDCNIILNNTLVEDNVN